MDLLSRTVLPAALVALVAACTEKHSSPADAAPPRPSMTSSANAASAASSASSPPAPSSPPAATALAAPSDAGAAADAGATACKAIGVAPIPGFNGPAVLRVAHRSEGDAVEVVINEAGVPRAIPPLFALADAGLPSEALPPRSAVPACALAGDTLYCPDVNGGIHRGDRVVARARSGTDIAAAMLGPHVLLAYIGERVTTEGLVREAYVTMDDGPPSRLSDEGSGATFVDLAPRGDGVVAMLIDARVALTPTHARILSLKAGKLDVGPDAVLFVGGSAERHNAGTLTTSKAGAAFALIAVSNDAMSFGMAAVKIDDPPKIDAPAVWSMYPNGLDPAPIAATRGLRAMHVARVRPKAADPKAPRLLEYGDLDAAGVFRAPCMVAEASFVKDVELAVDKDDSAWIFFRDPRGSRVIRLERRTPPPAP